jgi:hypothetical protein
MGAYQDDGVPGGKIDVGLALKAMAWRLRVAVPLRVWRVEAVAAEAAEIESPETVARAGFAKKPATGQFTRGASNAGNEDAAD